MAYDEELAARVRHVLRRRRGITERKMFGGVAFMLKGNMCCGVLDDVLILRLGPELAAEALEEPHTREMDFTGRPMKSMIYVEPAGYESDEDLREWVDFAVEFAKSLPAK